MNELEKTFFSTTGQKILELMVKYPDKQFYEREIVNLADVSIGGANQVLKELDNLDLFKKEVKGRMNFYKINLDNPIVRQLKILSNLIHIKPLIKYLKPQAIKIILFGSAAEGTNIEESDYDIFIVTNEPEDIERIIGKSAFKDKVQAIIKNPLDQEKMIGENETLWYEIERGIVLSEREGEDES